MKFYRSQVLMGFLLFLTAMASQADPIQWEGILVDPNDPDSIVNRPESVAVDASSYAVEEEVTVGDLPLAFGEASTSIYNINPSDWQVRGSTFNLGLASDRSIGPDTSVAAPLHLPSGALITSVTVYYNDTGASNPSAGLWTSSTTGTNSLVSGFSACFPTFSGGDRACTINNIDHTVDNAQNHYSILLILNADNRMYRMRINYRLQRSPAPPFATFFDVPTSHTFHRSIEALAASGITGGCGGGNYCPDDFVTRGQMAAFLARALGLHWPN